MAWQAKDGQWQRKDSSPVQDERDGPNERGPPVSDMREGWAGRLDGSTFEISGPAGLAAERKRKEGEPVVWTGKKTR
jgi:hypothetical protein